MKKKILLRKLKGYYAIPHELLHVLAFHIIGKPCQYQWGDLSVKPLAQETLYERLFVSLLPFAVIFGTALFFILTWETLAMFINQHPEQYGDYLPWSFMVLLIGGLFLLYSTTSAEDLLNSYVLLFEKNKTNNPSPQPHHDTDPKQE
jgi:hypothetical protein